MAVPARVPAAAGWLGMDDFSTSLEQLKDTVREACAGQDEWPARIAAGIRGAVDFCVSNPDAAEVLVIDTKTAEGEGDYLEMVDGFAEFIEGEVNSTQRSAGPGDEALVGAIASIVAYHLRSGASRPPRGGGPGARLPGPSALPRVRRGEGLGREDNRACLRKLGAVCGCPWKTAGNRSGFAACP